MTRTCKRCNQTKPIWKFPFTNSYIRLDGTQVKWRKWTCRLCIRGY